MGTEKFDQQKYINNWQKKKTAPYNWRIRKDARARLDSYAVARKIPLPELLRQLVDADAKAHGLPPVFAIGSEVETETDQK